MRQRRAPRPSNEDTRARQERAASLGGRLRLRTAPLVVRLVIPLGMVLTVFLVFGPALQAGFVNWDDDDLLENNTSRLTFSRANLGWMFTTSFFGHYHPLTWLSYAFDFFLWGGKPFGYHLSSLLLHAAAAVMAYFVARKLLGMATGKDDQRKTHPFLWAASFSALLFACHPLRAESVAWLAERRDVLSGLLYLVSIAAYLQYATSLRGQQSVQGRETARVGLGWYIATFAFFILSLLAKAGAITFAAVLMVLDVYPFRRLGGAVGWWEKRARRVWLEKLPFLVVGLVFAWRAWVAQREAGSLWVHTIHDWPARCSQACYGLVFYVWRTVFPVSIGPLYQVPGRAVLMNPAFWGTFGGLVLLGGIVSLVLMRRLPGLAAAVAAYAVVVSPVLGLAQSGPQLVADRYSYISCLGFAVLAGWALLRWGTRVLVPRGSMVLRIFWASALVVVLALSWATFGQTRLWADPIQLWAHGVRVSPQSSIAHCNYADVLARAKRYDDAYAVYMRALELNPRDATALHHAGDLHLVWKKYDLAIDYYRRAIAADPRRKGVHFILARLLSAKAKGASAEALSILRDGAQRHSEDAEMLDYLANMLATSPDPALRDGEEAVRWATKSCAITQSKDAAKLLTWSTALAEAGRFDEALLAAESAQQVAEEVKEANLVAEIKKRRALFEQERPYHHGD